MRGSNKVELAPAREIIQKKTPSVVNHLIESGEEAATVIRPLESDEEVVAVTPLLESYEEEKYGSKKRQRSSGTASLARSASWPSFFGPVIADEYTPTIMMSPLKSKFQKINQSELKKSFTPN